jgi:hypothetical protein
MQPCCDEAYEVFKREGYEVYLETEEGADHHYDPTKEDRCWDFWMSHLKQG